MVSLVSLECLGNMSVLDGELGATFLASLGKDLAAGSGLGTDEKSVGLCSLSFLWLVRL